MITFGGTHVTREFGAPTIRDIAVQAMRIVRFGGAGDKYFWPVGMHSLLVADLLPDHLEHHALLHDAAEVIMGEIPRPMKTDEQKAVERVLMVRIYDSLGLDVPTTEEEAEIKLADTRAGDAEGNMGCGGRGYAQVSGRSGDDETRMYLADYLADLANDYRELLDPNGFYPQMFERRLRDSIKKAQAPVVECFEGVLA